MEGQQRLASCPVVGVADKLTGTKETGDRLKAGNYRSYRLRLKAGACGMEKIPAFYFDRELLQEVSDKHKYDFATANPFPHVVIDDFIPEEILNIVADEFPSVSQIDWTYYGSGLTKKTGNKNIEKVGTHDESSFGPFTRHFMGQLNSSTFVSFLEGLTQAPGLLVDPLYN